MNSLISYLAFTQPNLTDPILLAIETSTPIGSVAIFRGSSPIGYIEYRQEKSHARLLSPMIRTLLQDLDLSPSDLDAVGVSKGPGSYTGLRVGVSTAKGLCMAIDKPLLSLGSMETLAWKVQDLARQAGAWICPMIDARRMEVYCAFFDGEMNMQEATRASILTEDPFREILQNQKVIFLGSGAEKSKAILSPYPNALILGNSLSSAIDMGAALHQKFITGDFEDLLTFEPFYLKDFVATKPRDMLKGSRK